MRKYSVLLSCIIFLATTVSLAHADNGWYLGANLGGAWLNDSDITDPTVPGVTLELSYDFGIMVSGFVGYQINQFRIEGEIGYQENDIDDTSGLGVTLDSTGDVTGTSFLLNGYYDFNTATSFTPYITAGIGYAEVEVNDYNIPGSGALNYSDDDSVFAFQVGAGVGYAINTALTLDVKYRYFATEDPEFGTSEAEISSHQIMLGLRYRF